MEDFRRRDFLDALDRNEDVDVSTWEANFIESTLDRECFSPSQRQVIDTMVVEYGDRVKW